MSLRLEGIEGPTKGQSFQLTGIAVIGRDPHSAVVVPAPTVSREHAVLRPDDAGPGFVIEDLDSRSGTFVNGARTRRAVLLEGDRVQVGPAVFRVGLREDALAGQVDPRTLEDVPAGRPQTMRLSIDAVRFRLRASDLEPGAAESGRTGSSPRVPVASPLPGLAPPPTPVRAPAPPPETPSERLEAIIELLNALASTHDPARLSREVARRLLSFFPRARRVGFFELDRTTSPPGLAARLLVDRSSVGAAGPARSVRISRAVLDEAVLQRRAVLVDDLAHDARFAATGSAAELGTRSVLCAPLCSGEDVLGALYLDTDEGALPFDEGSLRFLAGIATVVATAVESSRLFARIQKETSRRASLERYFSPDLVERVLSGEIPLARDGEVRRGTILFTDIRGFTRMTDSTEPRVLVSTLNAYFEAMQRIIFRARGTVERFGGDSILAYWSVIDRDPLAPRRAARAALAMQNELYRLGRDLAASGRPTIEIGIGVNTGDVIAGDVGSAERYEFTVLGDAINVARRIEDLAGAGEVLVGGATLAELGPDALVRALPDRVVKGKERPVSMGALLGLRADEPPRHGGQRWDLALGASYVACGEVPVEARLVGLETTPAGEVLLELAGPDELPRLEAVKVSVRLPACARAREVHGHGVTAELSRPLELSGRVDALGPLEETASPAALSRAVAAVGQGLALVRVVLDEPAPLLAELGLAGLALVGRARPV